MLKQIVGMIGVKQLHNDPCVFSKLDENHELALIMSVPFDNCAVTSLESGTNCFVSELKKKFKIINGGLLKKHIWADYEWDAQSDGKEVSKLP